MEAAPTGSMGALSAAKWNLDGSLARAVREDAGARRTISSTDQLKEARIRR